MSTPREKVQLLLALALAPGTPVEEARTAAMSAVKLIAAHRMLEALSPPPPVVPPVHRPVQRRPSMRVVYAHVQGTLDDEDVRRTLEDLFSGAAQAHPPQHRVATQQDYPTQRVTRIMVRCFRCARIIPAGALVEVDLDDNGREVLWHPSC